MLSLLILDSQRQVLRLQKLRNNTTTVLLLYGQPTFVTAESRSSRDLASIVTTPPFPPRFSLTSSISTKQWAFKRNQRSLKLSFIARTFFYACFRLITNMKANQNTSIPN